MPLKGRSDDDLPLAAYSTGVDPDTEPDNVPSTDPPEQTAATVPPGVVPSSGTVAAPLGRPFGDQLDGGPFGQSMLPVEPPAGAGQPAFLDLVRNPRANLREPRLLLSGVIAIGVVLLALSLLGGGGPSPAAALASPTPPAGPVVTAAPAGDASVEMTGSVTGTFALTGITGTGRPSGTTMASSWGDQLGDALALGGPVSAGTRTTDAGFVLSWTVIVNGKSVTFTSMAGECVIGMAIKPTTVSGSFTCHKIKSADGKLTVGATGTYRT